ncbi:MAG: DUF2029 domain-containing protein [Dermatophilaceae bacterium]|nr:DUF2029 domain-containing protein [Dermatophilaceae bacterium]
MSPHAPESVAPSRIDPVAASASEFIGGPLGRYAAPAARRARALWQPAAAVLAGLASLTVALGLVQKGHCFTGGWSSPDQFWHACYSDLPISAGIGQAMPYLPGAPHLDQPVISGLLMWLIGLLVPDGSAIAGPQWYFALWAVLITVVVMVLVVVTAASVPRTPWLAGQVALSPVLALAALVSVDLLGVLLASMALLAWGRRRIVLAGILLGLAVSARSYPLVLLVAIGLLAVRSGRVRAWTGLAATTLATCLAVTLPWLVLNSDALLSVYRTWWRSGPSYGALWMVSGLMGHGLPPGRVTMLVILGWLGALVVGAVFALSLDRRPTVAEVSLVMLVIVVVTGKTMPVQAGLWLLPLIALVGLRWRDHLIWAGFEVTYFVAVWLYIAGLSKPDRGLPGGGYSTLTLLRIAAWLYVLVQVWRVAGPRPPLISAEPEGRESEGQDSREGDEVDPLAGPMAGAPDQVLVRFS